MKVILTGANGALGSVFKKMYNKEIVSLSIRHEDVKAYSKLRRLAKKSDVLIHMGAYLHTNFLMEAISANTLLPRDIVQLVRQVNKRLHIILISSMSVLGKNGKLKKIGDVSAYTSSKGLMEEWCREIENVNVTIVRFSTLFYQDYLRDGLSSIIHDAQRFEEVTVYNHTRDFMLLPTACSYLSKICGNKEFFGKTINIASGKPIKLFKIGEYLKEKYGTKLNKVKGYVDNTCHKFSTKDVKKLGEIDFDIYEYIDLYYEKLKKEEK